MPKLNGDPFALGVASGDPNDTSVILWTRVITNPSKADGGIGSVPVPVSWEVATDAKFDSVVASGAEVATADFAHSVHATVDGLKPDGTYAFEDLTEPDDWAVFMACLTLKRFNDRTQA